MRAHDILSEAPADEISSDLNQIGLTDQRRDSAKTVSVYVPAAARIDTIEQMVDKLPDAYWDREFSNSSIGAVRYKGGTIRVRPKGKAGKASAGLGNEESFINNINRAIEEAGQPINITFKGGNGVTWRLTGVKNAKGVGADTAGRKKADVVLDTAEGPKGVSLKKGNAEYWESADTYFGAEADRIIDYLVKRGDLELIPLEKKNSAGKQFVKLSREVASEATHAEVMDIVFGSDLQGQDGAIIKQTFMTDDFILNGGEMTVNCKVVIVEKDDIPRDQWVYFLIRNDSSRGRPKYKYPGIRATAIYRKRLNNNTLRVNRGE